MKLIFLYGRPATGKLTVAVELAKRTGFKLFHNHLTVDMLTPVFEFGSPAFVELRESIWLSVFEHACRAQLPGMIFTFVPERTVRQRFISDTIRLVESLGGDAIFVELTCETPELERRLTDASRARHGKLISLELFRKLESEGVFSVPVIPPPEFSVDTGKHSPSQSAAMISEFLNSRTSRRPPS